MRNHNSQKSQEFYSDLLVSIYLDVVSAILPQTEIDRDSAILRARSSNEGLSFLTKTLPALGKSIDVSLASGTALNLSDCAFKRAVGTNLPRFMHDVFKVVFRDDGVPWFATWYTDCVTSYFMKEYAVDSPSRLQVDEPPTVELSSVKDYVCREAFAWFLEQAGVLNHGVYLLGLENIRTTAQRSYPGSHLLDHWVKEALAIGLPSNGWVLELIDANQLCFPGNGEHSPRRESMAVALKSLRQVCFCFYKLNTPHTREQEAKTLADFVRVDTELRLTRHISGIYWIIQKQARAIIRRVLANANPLSGVPRHGPGAVATGEQSSEKHEFKRIYSKLNAVFPFDQWFMLNASHVCDSLEELQGLEVLEAGVAKVILVPKDSRGPRLISCEPLEYQWIQQSLMSVLVDAIENHPWSKGFVNFTDQSINRRLALEGSRTFKYVTLDMKEASDRVHKDLVTLLFPEKWAEALDASRTPATQLPDGTIMPMNKFAPMGSAVCFPVEALVFWALSVATIAVTHDLPLRKAATKVYVYGDDIICDSSYHGEISDMMPHFSLMLNPAKCCTAGPFKESCGMDAFYGHSVTPARVRSVWYDHPEPGMIASYVELSNEFYRRNMFEAAMKLELEVQWTLRSYRMDPVPTVSTEGPSCIAFVRPHERPIPKNRSVGCKIRHARTSRYDYHRLEVRGYRLKSKSKMTKTEGWPLALRLIAELERQNPEVDLTTTGAGSLPTGQYPIAHRVELKRAWTPLV